ncbi:MAG: decarboxylating NADP(+)-dependent phosphogluconate dehydrogenase [Gemmataceae bacterium]|uniref:6-phosphogluconate dehydrogenase, decarboxylating n=1 Tax=Thermogemmata fonticola TaxID=2755323 RepID=A0A7V9AAK9_9BACT|nr:decarboxylating NADP(+)-dependent phosphogluconate dehydrogenase [Thermogemmata fonticola]MBA2224827.1 decarboxylating NADP(+)-dependent phosphogluconate dehydrogenase [Thermogemmata fonticola]MCX8138887.1 decarboxylating NADP(+)-dependent phosphogluconate dehydrogenase [Gemmataceae bacterium]
MATTTNTGLADIGLIGLAVMGENLVLNIESRGYTVAVYNRTTSRVDEFLAGRGKGKRIIGTHSPQELAAVLKRPRKVMMLVKAGQAVDDTIAAIVPYLEPGDILIDGGNTHFRDTERRLQALAARGIRYIGTGVSGGEEGALRGPSIMPGGDASAWPEVQPIFQAIAAKVRDTDGREVPCCDWVGPGGAGHFVKMVHNGIEYGDMQLIGESYHVLKEMLGLTAPELHQVYARWNQGVLDSYLIEITANIFQHVDAETGKPLVEVILDAAGQKGTGKWTVDAATDNSVPLTLIAEAVFARCLSALKEQRVQASQVLAGPSPRRVSEREEWIADVEMALYASKIISYAQGFALMKAQAQASGWDLNYGGIAMLWRGGCIIRSVFLSRIKEAFDRNPKLVNLVLDPYFAGELGRAQHGWRRVVSRAVQEGIPVPAMASALAYYDGYRSAWLPANLLQAQRDYFGAHTYERVDKPRGQFFHTNWTGQGGTTTSGSYTV